MDSRRSTARARPGPDLDSSSTTKLPLQSGGGWCLATGRGYKTAWVSPGGTAPNDVPPHIRSVLNADAPAADVTPADVEVLPDGRLMADGTIAYNMGAGWWQKTDPTNARGSSPGTSPTFQAQATAKATATPDKIARRTRRLMMLDRHCVGRPHQQMLRLQELR